MRKVSRDPVDRLIRAHQDAIPVPSFDVAAFTAAPPLLQSTVAIVTTAGLQRPGEEAWGHGDQSFRVFEREEKDLTCSHVSLNFDRSGLTADLNVVYPVDRLCEMAEEGAIGAVARRHVSFMGAQSETMSSIRLDTGPAAARLLLDDGVDVVLLTPV